MRHWTTEQWLSLLAQITLGASVIRVGLHWLRGVPLLQLIPATSKFWTIYDAVESTMAYVSVSLAAYGKKKAESTLAEPVVEGASAAEGKIEPPTEEGNGK